MPIDVKWDDAEQTIIRMDYSPPVSWEMFDSAMNRVVHLADSVNHRVDLLGNSGTVPMPHGSPIPHMQRAFKMMPVNIGVIVSPTLNPFARAILSTVAHIYVGDRFQAAKSLDHAYLLIEAHRAKNTVSS
jgi:hypothetical protein